MKRSATRILVGSLLPLIGFAQLPSGLYFSAGVSYKSHRDETLRFIAEKVSDVSKYDLQYSHTFLTPQFSLGFSDASQSSPYTISAEVYIAPVLNKDTFTNTNVTISAKHAPTVGFAAALGLRYNEDTAIYLLMGEQLRHTSYQATYTNGGLYYSNLMHLSNPKAQSRTTISTLIGLGTNLALNDHTSIRVEWRHTINSAESLNVNDEKYTVINPVGTWTYNGNSDSINLNLNYYFK